MSRSSRRTFLGTLGAAAVALPQLGASVRLGADLSAAAPAAGQGPASYDLLITGGRVIDPSQSLSAERDVAIANGKIAAVGANLRGARAKQVTAAPTESCPMVFEGFASAALSGGVADGSPMADLEAQS